LIDGKRVLAVVPARGGSKGIKLKNLRNVAGRSLVAHAGDVCRALDWLDRAVVSTDHDEIVAEAEASGLDAPFRRPEDLSGDRIGDQEVLEHALHACEKIDAMRYDIVVMLQPTSPLRRPEHVHATVTALLDGDWDAAWTVSETDSKAHPLKQLTIDEGQLGYYDPAGARIIARQQLTPVYHRNGIAYAITRECLVDQKKTMGRRTRAVVIDGDFVSIDTEHDIRLVEFLLSEGRA
jgi:CMP-N,N'-diacetyllegionaminic acid synthase